MRLTRLEKVAATASIVTALAVIGIVWFQYGLLAAAATAMVLSWVGTILVFRAADLLEGRRLRTPPPPQDKFVPPDD